MKIVMQTRGVMERFRTHRLFFDVSELIVVCHTHEQAMRIKNAGHFPDVRVHGLPEGVTAIGPIRDWIEKSVIPHGEWYAGIDDNIDTIFKVGDRFYDLDSVPEDFCTRDVFKEVRPRGQEIDEILGELRQRCEQQKTIYGGFGWMENPLFRRSKWQAHGYAKAKLYVKQNVGLKWKWDPKIEVMYDHAQTFRVIAEYGSVAVNRFVYIQHPQYEAGGIGSHAERLPFRKPTQDFLYEKFRGLVAPTRGDHDKPAICLRGQNSIDRWRQRNGWIKN